MTEESKFWTITPQEDPETGDLVITFPPDLLDQVGWKEGDILVWDIHTNGSVYLTKKESVDNDYTK